jgi:hypothetical protein
MERFGKVGVVVVDEGSHQSDSLGQSGNSRS